MNLSPEERERRSKWMRENINEKRVTLAEAKEMEIKDEEDRLAFVADVEKRNKVQRFGPADFTKWGQYLVDRLHERFNQLTDRNIIGWLRGEILSSESLFLCSPNAIGLFKDRFAPMDPYPHAEEVFVFIKDGKTEEGQYLYIKAQEWNRNKGGKGVIVERFTDLPGRMIGEAIGLRHDTKITVVPHRVVASKS